MLKVYNLDRQGTMPGGVSHPSDRAIVVDDSELTKHPLTKALHPTVVFCGTLEEANAFVESEHRNEWIRNDNKE